MIVQKKRQTNNESHSKLVLDLAKCPQSINKSKRELQGVHTITVAKIEKV